MDHPTPVRSYTATPEYNQQPEPLRLSHARHLFLEQRRTEGYSPFTLNGYGLHLTVLERHVGDEAIEALTLQDLRSHLAKFPHLKLSSMGAKIRAIRSMYRWAIDEGHARVNPTAKLKEPKLGARVPKFLPANDLEVLRDACQDPFEHALIEMFFATGARIREVHLADRDHVDMHQRSLVVHGKGSKEREVYFGAKAQLWLARYLDSRTDDNPALFVNKYRRFGRHNRMSTATIREHVDKIANRCGLGDRVTPHVLRHTLATHLINQGMPLAAVQSYLGHAKPETTLIYAHLSGTARRREFEKHFFQ